MLKSIGRFFRAIGYLFTGKVDSATKDISKNPHAVHATYQEIIEGKRKRIQQYKEAVAGLIAQEEKKLSSVKQLTNEVQKLENLKMGAQAKAKKRVEQLKAEGKDTASIKDDAEYLKCLAGYRDFSHTLTEKLERIAELEGDLGTYAGNIKDHKVQLQQLKRDMEKLKDEQKEAVAEVITSKEEKEIADLISGISEDRHSKELETMRELRSEMRAEARISRELAGTDAARTEAEFLEYARNDSADDEFEALIGLADEAETAGDVPDEEVERDAKLPE